MPLDPYTWADYNMLVDKGYDAVMAQRAVANASWMLWALSGRQLHGQGDRIDIYRLQQRGGRRDFLLATRPVRSVASVEIVRAYTNEVEVIEEETYWTYYNSRLVLRFGVGPHDRVVVNYVAKSNLPPGTYEVVLKLAEEYIKAATGQTCSLPQRVTSITRQGVTWTVLDPADFLEKSLLGVIPIDSWLMAVAPRRNKQRATVFDPRAPRLLSTMWLAVPFDSATVDTVLTYYGHGAAEDLDPTWLVTIPVDGDAYVDVNSGETYEFPL